MGARRWTDEEVQYLEGAVGAVSFNTIAKRLKRTPTAVSVKAFKLGLSNTKDARGELTLNHLSKLAKVDRHTVKYWVDSHGLKAKKRVTRHSAVFYFVSPNDFWSWARKNKRIINFSKIEPNSIIPEPDWVDAERRKDYRTVPHRRKMPYSQEEDDRMVFLVKQGYTYKEVGELLGRSMYSVAHRYMRVYHTKIKKGG